MQGTLALRGPNKRFLHVAPGSKCTCTAGANEAGTAFKVRLPLQPPLPLPPPAGVCRDGWPSACLRRRSRCLQFFSCAERKKKKTSKNDYQIEGGTLANMEETFAKRCASSTGRPLVSPRG
jgi:hypothetical protein